MAAGHTEVIRRQNIHEYVIEVEHLHHRFGERIIYRDLSFRVERGKIFGLLGRNGVGKTTLINILMGFLKPTSGNCHVFGEDSHAISPRTRQKIALLFEGHLTYDFMTIDQVENYYSSFYKGRWNKERYHDLVSLLGLQGDHKIAHMSCGQRSQVVLGLLFAQEPDLLILDDYSLGLDAGYRRLFLEYLEEYVRHHQRTVLLTSHVVQDMEQMVDEMLFLDRGGRAIQSGLKEFMNLFNCFFVPGHFHSVPKKDELIVNAFKNHSGIHLYTYAEQPVLQRHLAYRYPNMFQEALLEKMQPQPMSLEDAFIGLMGKY